MIESQPLHRSGFSLGRIIFAVEIVAALPLPTEIQSEGNSFDNYSTPPPPSLSPYNYYTNYSDNYSSGSYFPGYYPGGAYPPPPPPHPFFECTGSYAVDGSSVSSAPLEYSSSFDSRPKGGKMGL
ncbi:uncharacterized protein [Medicago truncatula]|uniref:Uncharacterized protein n=1 Tax=Medicago truncatula TaxID=3880 RepID=A0A072UXE6_MEDTR|nr:uncharacterized protein LOC25490861 [Medicago truncatula]KEH34252.1 hypothetical protein MTR_3g463690 [Medicago truncatula]